ncbi:MAG: DUF4093 domain-containing protein, partial [Bacillota bacterium]|nr:DUF4093 domain-containing protein [Bacillota bacterium]
KELPGCRILHARIVREDAVRDGDIGVENASGSAILEAILKAGATILGQSEELPAEKSMSERDMLSAEQTPTVREKPFEEEPSTEERTTEEERMSAEGGMTMRDMLEFGLAGDGSKQRRTSLGRRLGIGYANAGQFLHRLRVRHIGRDEVKELLERGHGKYDGR